MKQFIVSFIFDSYIEGNSSYGLEFVNKFLDGLDGISEIHTDLLFGDILSNDRPYNFEKFIDRNNDCTVPLQTNFLDYPFSITCLNFSKEDADLIEGYLRKNCENYKGYYVQVTPSGFIKMLVAKMRVDNKNATVYCFPEQEEHPFGSCFLSHNYLINYKHYE